MLFRAGGGYIGIAPPGTEVGDEVALMFGSPVLFVPREVEAPAQGPVTQGSDGAPRVWGRVVGHAYVQGIIDGEAAPGRGQQESGYVATTGVDGVLEVYAV